MKRPFLILFVAMWGYNTGVAQELLLGQYAAKEIQAEGTPFLIEEYTAANITLKDGTSQTVLLKYNVADNAIIANVNGIEHFVNKDAIRSFTIEDRSKAKSYTLEPIRIGEKVHFVEILYTGTGTKFAKWYKKVFVPAKPQSSYAANNMDMSNHYEEKEVYLFVFGDRVEEYSRKKGDLIDVLSNGNESLKNFIVATIKKKKLKSGNESDVIALLKDREDYIKSNP